ncbi:MAG: hypothetical protein KBE73_03205 [Fusobacteriaceae bacterium]|nr:hypothetical protein [Fusobacteriaceae bacterium]MBP9510125.1 hypothetical protein [Fusobacteriaceae bacterium]
MKKKFISIYLLLLLLICSLSYSAQLITDGQLSFYYDKEKNEIINIKGNQLGIIDISKIDIGIIKEKKFYLLKDFYKEVNYDLKKSKIEILGEFQGEKFTLDIQILDKNLEEIEFKLNFKEMKEQQESKKIVYKIEFEDDYEGLKRTINKSSPKKINFSDKNGTGAFYLSKIKEMSNEVYSLIKVDSSNLNIGMRGMYPCYITELKEQNSIFVINFREKNKKIEKTGEKEVNPLLLTDDFDEHLEIKIKQLRNLNALLSRGIVVDKITESKSKIFYEKELDMEKVAYEEGLIPINQIIPKENQTEFEELYFNYTMYEIVNNNMELLKYEALLRNKVVKYINSNFERIYSGGELKELYYLTKIMERVNKIEPDKYSEKLAKIKSLVESELILNNTLKSSKNSKIGNPKNLKYLNILNNEKFRRVVLEEYNSYYNRVLGVLIKENSDLVDFEYNLEMVRLLREIGEIQKADMLLAKIEYLIKNNNYYIPQYYSLNGNNNQEIYGDLISRYLTLLQ